MVLDCVIHIRSATNSITNGKQELNTPFPLVINPNCPLRSGLCATGMCKPTAVDTGF